MEFTEATFRTWLRMHPKDAIAGYAGSPSGCIMHSFLNDLPGVTAVSVSGSYWLDENTDMQEMPKWGTEIIKTFDRFLKDQVEEHLANGGMLLAGDLDNYSKTRPVTFGEFARVWDPVHRYDDLPVASA
jgi:hypothetical protein